jgi:hypothetical protein
MRFVEYGGWEDSWNLVLHLKLLHEAEVTRAIGMMQDPLISPFFWLPPSNIIPQILQNFDVKHGIHCMSYRDKLLAHYTKLSKKQSA